MRERSRTFWTAQSLRSRTLDEWKFVGDDLVSPDSTRKAEGLKGGHILPKFRTPGIPPAIFLISIKCPDEQFSLDIHAILPPPSWVLASGKLHHTLFRKELKLEPTYHMARFDRKLPKRGYAMSAVRDPPSTFWYSLSTFLEMADLLKVMFP